MYCPTKAEMSLPPRPWSDLPYRRLLSEPCPVLSVWLNRGIGIHGGRNDNYCKERYKSDKKATQMTRWIARSDSDDLYFTQTQSFNLTSIVAIL